MANDYGYFVNEIFKLTQIDLSSYKENQMKRRIDAFIMRHNSKGYDDFIASIKKDKQLLEEFVEYITINVSEFYRNPEQWKYLTEQIFPMLIERFGKRLTIWSAACSTGDEPYSLVMALSQYVPLSQIRTFLQTIRLHCFMKGSLSRLCFLNSTHFLISSLI